MRVPTPNVSIVDLTAELDRDVTPQEINDAFRAAASGPMAGIVEVQDAELVSVDFIGNPHSAIIDTASTNVVAGLVKVMAWYDNEWGYSSRCVDLTRYVGERL